MSTALDTDRAFGVAWRYTFYGDLEFRQRSLGTAPSCAVDDSMNLLAVESITTKFWAPAKLISLNPIGDASSRKLVSPTAVPKIPTLVNVDITAEVALISMNQAQIRDPLPDWMPALGNGVSYHH